jgi:DNA polymerase III epsilon subunit-like protein
MSGLKYYCIDTETTGLSTAQHEINEYSIIRCDDRVQLTTFIKCETPWTASYDSLRITGKTMADLDTGDSKEIAIEKLNKFISEDGLTPAHRCFIMHNVGFDRRFIHKLYEKVGQTCPVSLYLCTMAMTRAWAKKAGYVKPKVNLNASCDLVGIKKVAGSHQSKMDTRNTYLLYRDLVEVKKFDYLPFIKNLPHNPIVNPEDEPLDPDLLDVDED